MKNNVSKNNNNFINNSKTKNKLSKSQIVVFILMIIWTIGSVLSFISLVKDCKSSVNTASADVIDTGNIVNYFDTNKIDYKQGVTFNGNICNVSVSSGYPVFTIKDTALVVGQTYTLVFNVESFSSSALSAFGLMYTNNVFQSSTIVVNNTGLFYFNFTVESALNYIEIRPLYSDTGISFQGILSNFAIYSGTFNDVSMYLAGYNQGYLDSSTSADTSFGIFDYCTLRYGVKDASAFDFSQLPSSNSDLTNYKILPTSYYNPYKNGIYFYNPGNSNLQLTFNDLVNLSGSSNTNPDIPNYQSFLIADFGKGGLDATLYSNFVPFLYNTNGTTNSFKDYIFSGNNRVIFYFTDNTYISLYANTDSPSMFDLTSNQKKLRYIYFTSVTVTNKITCLRSKVSNAGSYNAGYLNGYDSGYKIGYDKGNTIGYNSGYNKGVESANNYSFLGLIGAIVDAPVSALSGLLNFDLLGFNMFNFFTSILTCALIIFIVRLFI